MDGSAVNGRRLDCTRSLCSCQWSAQWDPKCDVCQRNPHKSSPWQPVVERNEQEEEREKYVDFVPDPEQPYALWLTLHQNAFTMNTRHVDHHYCTHTNTHQCLRKESFCMLGLLFVYVLCCTPEASNHRCTCTHTSATEPLNFCLFFFGFLLSLTFCSAWQTRTRAERRRPWPLDPTQRRMPVWSLSEWFMCTFLFFSFFVRSKLLSSFRT